MRAECMAHMRAQYESFYGQKLFEKMYMLFFIRKLVILLVQGIFYSITDYLKSWFSSTAFL